MTGSALRILAIVAAIALVWFGFSYQYSGLQDPNGEPLALLGARVIDGTGALPLDDAVLLISQGRIAAVGPSDSIDIPAGATRIDMRGKTILPGLINAHGHVTVDDNTELPLREHMEQRLQVYADYGVTAVVSLGSNGEADELEGIQIRDEQRQNLPTRARLFTGGLNARGENEVEARESVARLAALGVDVIKYHINGRPNDMTPPVYGALVDEAKRPTGS